MSKKNGIHISENATLEILKFWGFNEPEAKAIGKVLSVMTFQKLDNLYHAISLIRKGE